MKLRTRILVSAGVTLAALVAVIYVLSSRLLLSSYADLERQDAQRNMQVASRAFSQLASDLHVKAADWAEWDDSYQFMTDHNEAFIRSNMAQPNLASMKLDAVVYLALDGKVFCAAKVKRLSDVATPSPSRILAGVGLQRILAARPEKGGGFYGAIPLAGSPPMLVSVRPVLTSRGAGPARGWLIFGRYFDRSALSNLGGRTRLDVQTWDLDKGPIPPDGTRALQVLTTPTSTLIHPMNDWSIACYGFVADVADRPICLMRVLLPRSIYIQGAESVQYLMRLILLASFIYSIVILITLEYFAFSRLAKLTHQVEHIDGKGSLTRVDLPGRDELTLLANTINGMLSSLDESSRLLRESEESLRVYNENLEKTVLERTRQIEHLAFHDSLTGLSNRALFMNRLEVAWARAQRSGKAFAVIFVDLDKFKYVNDTLGHEAGDQLLKSIAERLMCCIRLGDTVARLGGDEFTILMEALDSPDEAARTAESIVAALSAPFLLGTREIYASASIGVAVRAEETDAPEVLLRNADTAMYEAKAAGKSGYLLFDPSMHDHADERRELENELRFALERHELFLNYQPLINLESRKMVGVEALLRWNNPTRGIIQPGKFITIAEETGLVVPIGYWVLEQACIQAKRWHEEYPEFGDFTMNVNLSGKQLQRPDIVSRVQEVLLKTGVNPGGIKLEITESVMMTDLDTTVQRLHALKALGVKLAMDDFGTGYSCMANMDTFPLDTIKIDRAFIQRLSSMKDSSGQMVKAIIAISRSLQLDVTGEGVENADQVMQLKGLGCDTAQGYFYSRPLAAEALQAIMAAGPDSLAAACENASSELKTTLPRAA